MFVEVSNLTFGYSNNRNIINNISFAIEKGTILGILGVSGSGKTTIMRLMSGLITSGSGNLLEGSISIENYEPIQYRQMGKLSFMFQEEALMPNLSARDNILLPTMINGTKDFITFDEIIETVGLDEYELFLPKALSGGMRARVELARCFITNPELLLLDEPFSSLDVGWKSKIYAEIKLLAQKYDTTTVLVTHDINEALELSDRLLILSVRGSIIKNMNLSNDESRTQAYQEVSNIIINDHYSYFKIRQ